MAYEHILKMLGERNKSQRELADFLGVSEVIVSNLFTGRRQLKSREAISIAEFLNVPVAKVLNGYYQSDIPIIGNLVMSGMVELTLTSDILDKNLHQLHQLDGVEFVPCPTNLRYPDMFAVRVTTDDYAPAEKGALYYCVDIITEGFQRYLDKRCFIKTKNNNHYIRWIRRGSEPGLYDLVSDRHETLKDVRIDWCARIKITEQPD